MAAEKIDVLAVMDQADDFIARVNGDDRGGSLAEARAAVAEMHKALMAIAASRIEATGAPPIPDLTAHEAWSIANAALARVGGA